MRFSSLRGQLTGKPWKPHPINVIPGVPLKADDIKPYVPPKLAARAAARAERREGGRGDRARGDDRDPAVVLADGGQRRPGRAAAGQGRGQAVRGGCSAKVWYALEPFGYICGREAHPTDQPATTEQVLTVTARARACRSST